MDNVKNATEHMVCLFLKNIQKSNDFEFSVRLCFSTNVLFIHYLCTIYVLFNMYYLCDYLCNYLPYVIIYVLFNLLCIIYVLFLYYLRITY